ncbi:MAG: DCC1-like thiol-disulfide oxidoreductase family protein [Myxococcota bacterium]
MMVKCDAYARPDSAALVVYYDAQCSFCRACARWLERQPALLSLQCMPSHAGIPSAGKELVVVVSDGRYWIGPAAFVMCLWALAGFHWLVPWLLSAPTLTYRFFNWVGTRRGTFARWFRTATHQRGEAPGCASCSIYR